MLLLQQSEATAAYRRIPIYLVDATNGYTPETGLSSGFTIEVSENGAAQASGGGSITEIGEGQYYYEATAAELSTLGFLAISIRHASCRDFFAVCQVVAFDPYSNFTTNIDDIETDTNEIQGKLPTNNIMGSSVLTAKDDEIDAIKAVTDLLPNAGALTDIDTGVNNVEAKLPTNYIMGSSVQTDKDDEVDAIKAKTDNLPADPTSEANATTNTSTIVTDLDDIKGTGFIKDIDSLVDIRPETDKIQTIDDNVDLILVDTDATIPGLLGTIQTDLDNPNQYKADVSNLDQAISTTESNIRGGTETLESLKTLINALNNLSSADVQTILENNDLDHLIQVAAGAENPTIDSYFDQLLNKDGSQTYDPTTDSLEAQKDAGGAADWTSGEKENIRSALGVDGTKTSASGGQLQTMSTNIDDIETDTNEMQGKLPTNNIMGSGVLTDKDDEIDQIITDIAALNNISTTQVNTEVDSALADIDLDHLIQVAAGVETPTVDSYIDQIMNKAGTQDFDPTTDSLEAIRDNQSAGGTDWTSGEKEQIRDVLGVDGTKTAATGGDIQSIESKIDIVDTNVDDIEIDTNEIQGKLPTDNIMGSSVLTSMDDEIDAIKAKTDLLNFDAGNRVDANLQSILDTLMTETSAGRIANNFDFFWDNSDAQTTKEVNDVGGGAAGLDAIIIWYPSIPFNIDLAATKTVRLALYITDALDDLPSTAEITPGTITIDRSADGGTSWTTIRNAVACSEHAGCVYYDEVFSSGNGYGSDDMIRIIFKGQIVVIAANNFEIADATNGIVLHTRIDAGAGAGSADWTGGEKEQIRDALGVDGTKTAAVGGDVQSIESKVDIIDTNVDDIETDTGTTLPASLATIQADLDNPNQYKADVSGVATEANATTNKNTVVTEVNANETKIDTIDTVVDAIKLKTDNLKDAWNDLSQAQVNTEVDNALDTVIPTTPTANSINERVKQIDENPNTYKADITSLATETNATTNKNSVITEVDANETKIDTIDTVVDAIKLKTDNLKDSWNDLSEAQVNAQVDGALNTAIPGSPIADSINERIKQIDENPGIYKANVVNLDQAISVTESNIRGGTETLNTIKGDTTSIKSKTDNLPDDTSGQIAITHGLLHKNIYTAVYWDGDDMTGAQVKLYDSAFNAGVHSASGLLLTLGLTGTFAAGKTQTILVVEE